MTGQPTTRMVAYWSAKQGTAPFEWEDGAAYSPSTGWFSVTDGASTGSRSREWAYTLAHAFVTDRPAAALHDDRALLAWIAHVRNGFRPDTGEFAAARTPQWVRSAGAARGSHATFLGGRLDSDRITAVAVGDSCLFHLSRNRSPVCFPVSGGDFGTAPLLITSRADDDARWAGGIRRYCAPMAPGDVLLGATDALAQWLASTADRSAGPTLARIGVAGFGRLCADLRRSGQMKNDDVTMWRAAPVPATAHRGGS